MARYMHPFRVRKLSEREFRSWTGADLRETKWQMSDGTIETEEEVIRLNTGDDDDGGGRWPTEEGGW